jgi:hypothetical protein
MITSKQLFVLLLVSTDGCFERFNRDFTDLDDGGRLDAFYDVAFHGVTP